MSVKNQIFEHKMYKDTGSLLNYIESLSNKKTFIFVDTETTGLGGHKKQQLTQVSAIAYDYNFTNNKLSELDRYNNKIKLTTDILKRKESEEGKKQLNWVLSFNRYGEKMGKYKDEKEVLHDFFSWVNQFDVPLLVMQNAEFDMNMLCGRSGIKIKWEVLDTKQLLQLFVIPVAQKLSETNPKYQDILKNIGLSERDYGLVNSSMGKWGPFFNVNMAGYHNSLMDCEMTSNMFLGIVDFLKININLDIKKYQNDRIIAIKNH